jgi:O-antigen/teichoic acid export membrane protein
MQAYSDPSGNSVKRIESLSSVRSPLEPNDIGTLARGASIALLGRILGRGLNTLVQVLLARLLGPVEFGLYALGWTLIQMGTLLAPIGLDKGVIRFGSRFYKSSLASLKGTFFQSTRLVIANGAILSIVAILSAPTISGTVFKNYDLTPVLRGLSPVFIFFAGLKVTAAATRVTKRMKYSVVVEDIVAPAFNLLLFITLYIALDLRLSGAIISASLSFAIAFFLSLFYLRKLFPEIFDRDIRPIPLTRELISYSLPTSLSGILTMFIIWTNRLVIGMYLPESEVGIFQVVSQISLLPAIILSGFTAIFSPMIADQYNRNQNEKLRETYVVSTKWSMYLGIPFFLILFLAPKDLLDVVFGSQYIVGAEALVLLSLGQLINVGSGSVGALLLMTGHQKIWIQCTFGSLLVSIATSFILVPEYGLIGAAFATSIGIGGLYTLGMAIVRKIHGFWPYDKRVLKGVLATAVTLIISTVLRHFLPQITLLRFIVLLTICFLGFIGVLLLLGLDKEDKDILDSIYLRLKGGR